MTDGNPVTDEMLRAFYAQMRATFAREDSGSLIFWESYRRAIWAAIKAGGFVSAEQMRDEMAERVAGAVRAADEQRRVAQLHAEHSKSPKK